MDEQIDSCLSFSDIIVKYSKTKGIVIKKTLFLILILFFTGCALKQPTHTNSATILIKTPAMKFYDRGFINIFPSYTQVQVFSAGTLVLNLKIYEDRVCRDTFECQTLKQFNKEQLSSSYEDDFLKKLFEQPQKEIYFKDKANGVLIKVTKD